ncbi:UbiC transcription regulator-associated domain-containing protein [Mycolicibacterium thermoresistibile ATCC 19527]|uniref:UbiC transcription regulator-associated domain-containing protein n=2 Tax=Mycolicibacterium thermoresistibile TaxID=1797 RepID=G7CBN1_MYCT3|nr:UbiC transcription regulator-associated domain-containing protein [Mycolicibacterium thermoresistibile ATCC 19527]MCV7188379.1 GntR family transcriptional regulator [Mycolicibacterium thermoresistibile]
MRSTTINRFADRPLYRQLSEVLEARLIERARPGDRLPSEAELSGQFGVNRLTVRRALHELAQRGIIETVHGRGSFVARQPVRYRLSATRDASFTRGMRELGHPVRIEVLGAETTRCRRLRTELHTAGEVLTTTTLRHVDGQPWSVSVTSIALDRFPGIAQQWSGSTSLFDFLWQTFGVRMRRAYRSFSAVLADLAEAQHLGLRTGAPVLEMRGLNVDQHGAPVAVVRHRFRGDRVELTVDLA